MNLKKIDTQLFIKMLNQGAYNLEQNKGLVDSLNVFPVPDGDTGTNMSMTIQTAIKNISNKEFDNVYDVSNSFARGLLMGARGNSGVILSQIFRGFSNSLKDKKSLTTKDVIIAFSEAKTVAYKAVIKPVEGTILTLVRLLSKKLDIYKKKDITIEELFEIIIKEGNIILEQTPDYLDVLKKAGVVDSGAKGLMLILEGFYNAILGKEAKISFYENETNDFHGHLTDEEIVFGYCTEFIVKTNIKNESKFQKKVEKLGDSMVFVRDDDLIKVHIHTNEPNLALKYALEVGELQTIKIENMRLQHQHILDNEMAKEEKIDDEHKKYRFVSVCLGEGFNKLFKDLGCDLIIEGGQTMNPSTEDITNAINKLNADNIFVFPNNSNVILACNQAKELTDKNVIVIPTKNIPQGISSMIAFDEEVECQENIYAMTETLEAIETIQITYSVRDTEIDGKNIKKDDIISIVNGEINAVGDDINEIAYSSIKDVINDHEIVTIYYGSEVSEEKANDLVSKLSKEFSDVEVEMYEGKQPLYYYIISLEL